MSDVKQTIQVTNAGLSPILSIAQGTGMVEFEFMVSDFLIPAGSAAVAWNIQPTGNVVSKTCTISGNTITVQPPAYYFLRGKNYMQIQVTGADGVNLFTFLIEVWCYPNISAPVVSQNPDLISQLIQLVGNTEDLETTSKSNLVAAINEIYNRGVVDVLDTEEEVEANTATGKATGALVAKQLISDLGGLSFGQDTEGNWGYKPSGADAVIPFSFQETGQAIWGNINSADKGYTQVDLGFKPKKLIGYTVDDGKSSTLAIEVIYFNIWADDNTVHRRCVSRYYDYVLGDDPNRLVITDTGFTMYNSGGLWVGKTFYYMAFRT